MTKRKLEHILNEYNSQVYSQIRIVIYEDFLDYFNSFASAIKEDNNILVEVIQSCIGKKIRLNSKNKNKPICSYVHPRFSFARQREIQVEIGPIQNDALCRLLKSSAKKGFLYKTLTAFLPKDSTWQINIIPEESDKYCQISNSNRECFIGINTYIN